MAIIPACVFIILIGLAGLASHIYVDSQKIEVLLKRIRLKIRAASDFKAYRLQVDNLEKLSPKIWFFQQSKWLAASKEAIEGEWNAQDNEGIDDLKSERDIHDPYLIFNNPEK